MVGKTPGFWWKKQNFLGRVLLPLSWIYGYFSRRAMERKNVPYLDLPVLCVGNFTTGGSGKTPVVISLAKQAEKLGLTPGIVSRGYGGQIRTPHLVDLERDRARDVGDEPLLLVRHAPVAIATNRLEAAQLLKQQGCNFILMDDGFQSRRIFIDYALIVVDGLRGLGNNAVFPAGPLRAPLETQLKYTNSVLIIGKSDNIDYVIKAANQAGKPLQFAHLSPIVNRDVKDKSFLAFAGIGNPHKFFRSIIELKGKVAKTLIYPDHHFYSSRDLQDIIATAAANKLCLATTAKDFTRLAPNGQNTQLEDLFIFDVDVAYDGADFCQKIIEKTLENFKDRKF
ncbi:tetraacyldisaccharide 4'-kinase [uncultured Bartonella sp.]|uniref:tetraacyldisaccharide 4'-kinase n=1 Tax=uncultured Bartonella sp. TaxID=104108 RepID=UPI0026327FC9|nr:tetraacyldisaccharide 4'-kinase [uncultured Bartonella sp.]